MAEFGEAFVKNWRTVRTGVFKVEAWQTYQEPETQSLRAYLAGQYDQVEQLIEEEAEQDQFVYDDVRRNGTPFVRLRIAKTPLPEYLRWEFWNYRVRARRGETILVIDRTDDPRSLPNHSAFDFLLFDDHAALIHDYGLDGLQDGGWLVASPETLGRLMGIATSLREEATPLDSFISLIVADQNSPSSA